MLTKKFFPSIDHSGLYYIKYRLFLFGFIPLGIYKHFGYMNSSYGRAQTKEYYLFEKQVALNMCNELNKYGG